jgi:23S rRNA pseudouridine955/2504/2580 synthase
VNHIIGAQQDAPVHRRNRTGTQSGDAHAQAPQVVFLLVDEESAGQRLDNFLARCLKGVPKAHIYRIIRSGEVRVNKGRAEAQTRIAQGDRVRLPPVRDSERARQKAQRMAQGDAAAAGPIARGWMAAAAVFEPAALYEDDWFLALDKPAGMAVHGGSGVSFGLIERLRMARPQARFLELVHRLDRETSGVLLVAKKRAALTALQQQFRERGTGKTYIALVAGAWPVRKKVLDAPLHKYLVEGPTGQERRVRVARQGDDDAKGALTLVKVGRRLDGCTLLEVTIKTGRTHQIRVHLANAGHPILGDAKYGDFELNKRLAKTASGPGLRRMFLHAWRLQVDHPLSGGRIEIEAPVPADLLACVDLFAAPRPALAAPLTPAS